MTTYETRGRICQGVGGAYTVKLYDEAAHRKLYPAGSPLCGQTVRCPARGRFRYSGMTPLCGDLVTLRYTDASFSFGEDGLAVPDPNGTDMSVVEILPRRNELIRPAMANLDGMMIVASATHPQTPLLTLDKMTAIAVHNRIRPLILITKADLDPAAAETLVGLYSSSGFETLAVSAVTGSGIDALKQASQTFFPGRVSCLCGASGVGKSTLMNLLFPHLKQKTGEISYKNKRGRNTTREITLFDLSVSGYPDAWLADTPGFTMLDFEQFDFMRVEDLFDAFPEFDPYFGQCRYQDCAHVKEEGCAVLQAVREGRIPRTRHDSYAELYGILKKKKPWDLDSGSGRA